MRLALGGRPIGIDRYIDCYSFPERPIEYSFGRHVTKSLVLDQLIVGNIDRYWSKL